MKWAEGASLLLTTHQLDEAQQICERIVIIDYGRTIADGTFEELLKSTVGVQQRLTLRLSEPPPASLTEQGYETGEGNVLRRSVDDPAAEMPRIVEAVREAGGTIEDLHLETPSLQTVFIHLTGRELRE